MTLNKDSHQTILVKKLKNCIIISAVLVEIRKKNFFRIISQFQIKNIYLRTHNLNHERLLEENYRLLYYLYN